MKKKYLFFALISAVAIFSSCSKEFVEINDGNETDYPVFRGTMEDVSHADTKAGLDLEALKIAWNTGDEIFITDGSGKAIYQAKESGSGVTFEYKSGDVLAVGSDVNYVAYYPASMVQENGSLNLMLKQPYVSENVSYLPMKAESSGTLELNFRNLTGIIRLKYTPTSPEYPITHIGFTADRPLSGKFSIIDGKAVTETGTSYQGVVLDSFEETFTGNETKYFYLAVPEGAYSDFTINFSNSSRAIFLAAKSTINIYRSKITTIEYAGNALGQNAAKQEALNSEAWTSTVSSVATSNCYLVSKFTSTKVPYIYAVKGKNEARNFIEGGVAADVLWETDYNTTTPVARGSILRAVQFSDNKIYLQFPSSPKNGSAVVALRDANGEILWSWHIWVTPEGEPGTIEYTKKDGTKLCHMMDRNIGAHENSKSDAPIQSYGFYYQIGRKDPFVCPSIAVSGVQRKVEYNQSNNAYSVAAGIKNPTTYYGVKDNYWVSETDYRKFTTENDPCPQGYSVPAMSSTGLPWASSDYFTFSTTSSPTKSSWNESGWNYEVNSDAGTTWLPAAGYLSYMGNLNYSGERAFIWGTSKYAYFVNTGAGKVNKALGAEECGSTAFTIRCIKN